VTPQRANVILGILIVGLTVALIVPFARQARARAAAEETKHNLQQVLGALHAYHDTCKSLPPAFDSSRGDKGLSRPTSMHVHLLPYLEQQKLYETFQTRIGNEMAAVPAFFAPSDPSGRQEGVQNFAANLRVFSSKGFTTAWDRDMPQLAAVEPGRARMPGSFASGPSNTVVLATKFAECGEGGSRYAADPTSPYAGFFGQNAARVPAHPSDPAAMYQLAPGRSDCRTSPLMAQSFGADGLLVGMGDASTRTVSPAISLQTWARLTNPGHLFD
jgi:hypothetical protein